MDDTAQPVQQAQDASKMTSPQPQQPVVQQPVVPSQPFDNTQGHDPQQSQGHDPQQSQGVPPVSVPVGKETAPVSVQAPKEQWVQEHAPQAEVSQELQDAGVEAPHEEKVVLPPDVAGTGVTPVGTATPIPVEPTIKLPMTEEKAQQVLKKHGKWRLSVAWMAMLVVRQLQVLKFNKTKEKPS